MANYNELWDADNPSDSTNANEIDDYENNLRSMIAERIQDLIYGFTSGEDTDAPGFKLLRMKQASDPTTPADMVDLYCKDVGGNNEAHWDDEAGNGPAQLTAAGNIGGTNLELLAGKDLLGSSTSDITINTNKFTVAGATGNTLVAGTLDVQGNIDPTTYETTNGGFLDEDNMASDAADKVASQQSIKAYVDADHPAYSGGESHADGSGLIIKTGVATVNTSGDTTITYGTAFPTATISVVVSFGEATGAGHDSPTAKTLQAASFVVDNPSNTLTTVNWIAIGH